MQEGAIAEENDRAMKEDGVAGPDEPSTMVTEEEDEESAKRRQVEEQVWREEEEERGILMKMQVEEQLHYLQAQVKQFLSSNYELRTKLHENNVQTHILKSYLSKEVRSQLGMQS